MKCHLFFSFLFVFQCIYGQNDTINRQDERGKQGRWVYYGIDRPESGFPDSAVYETGNYIDNRKEGTWVRFYPDGKPKLKGEYRNNRPLGTYSKGNTGKAGSADTLVATPGSQQEKTVGPTPETAPILPPEFKTAPPTRNIPWKEDGYNKVYNSNGKILVDGVFRKGRLHDGKVFVYDANGVLLTVQGFKAGVYDPDAVIR